MLLPEKRIAHTLLFKLPVNFFKQNSFPCSERIHTSIEMHFYYIIYHFFLLFILTLKLLDILFLAARYIFTHLLIIFPFLFACLFFLAAIHLSKCTSVLIIFSFFANIIYLKQLIIQFFIAGTSVPLMYFIKYLYDFFVF